MAKRVTNEDIIRINEIYAATKVYAETARQTGFSASTVKKYVNPNYTPVKNQNFEKIEFKHADLPPYPTLGLEWRELMELSALEKQKIIELQKEVMI